MRCRKKRKTYSFKKNINSCMNVHGNIFILPHLNSTISLKGIHSIFYFKFSFEKAISFSVNKNCRLRKYVKFKSVIIITQKIASTKLFKSLTKSIRISKISFVFLSSINLYHNSWYPLNAVYIWPNKWINYFSVFPEKESIFWWSLRGGRDTLDYICIKGYKLQN